MKDTRYLSAKEVAEALNVSIETVYAYVSRGLLRSESAHDSSRARLYLAEDVQKLLERKSYRHDPTKAASDAMHWGMPVLESSLTLITENGLYYRGHDVKQLVETCSVEQVAALLWTGEMADAEMLFDTRLTVRPYLLALEQLNKDFPDLLPLQRLNVALTLASATDLAAYDLDMHDKNSLRTGARILQLMAAVLVGSDEIASPVATLLQKSWCRDRPHLAHLFNVALILCADHELNASSFTARVVASAQTQLYLVVIAGLAALQGFRHGGGVILVERLLREVALSKRPSQIIAEYLRRGEGVPGFGHRLYPQGDPRGALLLDLVNRECPATPFLQQANALVETVEEVTGKKPTLDFGLATLAGALQLPDESALALFALGRTLGWIGHAIEQYQSGNLIRPRARYIGPR